MDPSSPQSFNFVPSESQLNLQIESIVARWESSKIITIRDSLERQIFKLGIAIGMNECYNALLHTKPISPNNSISA